MRPPFLLLFSAAAIVLAVEVPARADDSAPTDPPPPAVTQWYGWQTMLTDGLSVGLLSAGAVSDNTGAQWPLGIAGLTGFTFAAPAVHAAHGRWGLAAADLGLRVAALTLGAFVGGEVGSATVPPSPCDRLPGASGCITPFLYGMDQTVSGALVGAALGGLVASAIDATVLSREKVLPKEGTGTGFSWSPSLAPMKDGIAAGVTGRF
jgi:hypothetical protein